MQHVLRRERPLPRLARAPRAAAPARTPTLEELEARLITEDDTPVENLYSEKERRLLPGSLHSGWAGPEGAEGARRPFVAMADVGLFFTPTEEPLVPDVLVSLDVSLPPDIWEQKGRSYFVWRYGKVPDVVIEIVSNRKGGELTRKLAIYAQHGVPWYVVHDPRHRLGRATLHVLKLRGKKYVHTRRPFIEPMGLGLGLWKGVFEDRKDTWLRWYDANGVVVPTGDELALTAQARAEHQQARAEHQQARAEHQQARADRLLAKLRALGLADDEQD